MFASTLAAPLSNFVGVLDRMRSGVYYVLEALKQTKDSEEPAKEVSEEAEAKTGEAGMVEVKAKESEPGKGNSPAENASEEQLSEDKNKKEENSDG